MAGIPSQCPLGLEGELMKVLTGGEVGSLGEPCPWRRALWKYLRLYSDIPCLFSLMFKFIMWGTEPTFSLLYVPSTGRGVREASPPAETILMLCV